MALPSPALSTPAPVVLAHEKWFVEAPGAYPTDWGFFLSPASLAGAAIAVCLAVVWRIVALRGPRPEVAVLAPLGRLAPWVPRLLAVHLGVSLLALSVTNSYLAPHLSLQDVPGGGAIALAQGFLGVWLISGVRLRPASVCVVALGPLGLALAGPVAVLEAVDLLGVALFLALLPPSADRWGARPVDAEGLRTPLLALRTCAGLALIVLAFSEKFTTPALAVELLEHYPALDLFRLAGIDLPDEAFVRVAASVELLFGLLLVSGAAPQVAVLVAGIPFNATLFFFGATELIGHLPVYGIMLALLVYGSHPHLSAVAPSLRVSLRQMRATRYAGDAREESAA
ncbi:MAG: hypothetical protein KY434_07205 [Actinobacteria bacterium]|nr:hypothetical protein [Actinomycetota bacterium]